LKNENHNNDMIVNKKEYEHIFLPFYLFSEILITVSLSGIDRKTFTLPL